MCRKFNILSIIMIFLFFTASSLQAQKLTPEGLKIELKKLSIQQYKQALQYGDASTAIHSLHQIIAIEGKRSTYKDSLVVLYFQAGNFASSHLLVKELLRERPQDIGLLEINAMSLQNLGAAKEAITIYEPLFAQTQNMLHGYQLGMLQYELKRLGEAQTTVSNTLKTEEIEDAYVQMAKDKNQVQNVPLKAAVFNLQGLIAYAAQDFVLAQQSFMAAMRIMPDFALATQNLNAMNSQLQDSTPENESNKAEVPQ